MTKEAYLSDIPELTSNLKVRLDRGLTVKEAKRRLLQGRNELPYSPGRSPLLLYLDRFKDVLVLVLLAAAIVSVLLGRFGDAVIIGVAIFLDATLSFAQVWRTERTLEKLREQVQPFAVVVRDGRTEKILAKSLVVGDLIELRAGERVPADARLVEVSGLRMKEASLTGESDDVAKGAATLHSRTPVANRRNMVFMGTLVVNGSGKAIVTATGTRSELGKIAQVLKAETSPPSPLRRKLQKVGLQIGMAVVVSVVALSALGVLLGADLVETSLTAITLVVSAVPEDLTMILTIVLTVGVTRILRRRGVVRELAAAETLGAATVICTDKTGTMTEGVMQAETLDFLQGHKLKVRAATVGNTLYDLALIGFALVADAHRSSTEKTKKGEQPQYVGVATERAALAFAEQAGLNQRELKKSWRQHDTISFNRRWMYRASLHDHPTLGVRYIFVAGAPEVLLAASADTLSRQGVVEQLTSSRRYELERRIARLAGQGKRLVAVAVRRNFAEREVTHDDVSDLLFLGVLVIRDPIRSSVRKSVSLAMRAGVKVKLVTGDHVETARAVAKEVGLTADADYTLTSNEINRLSDTELEDVIEDTVIFARVTPLDKQRIVRILQGRGHVVAMTGDGVNDAVALKSANIGVAMGSGKDIAKEAADLVLLDDSFETIIGAVREGRVLRDNIRKVIGFLLSTNAAEVAIFFASLIMGLPLPLLPAQILWVNLVTDGTSDIALSLEPAERGVMRRAPEDPQAPLIGRGMTYHIISTGVIITIVTMALFYYLIVHQSADLIYARTMAFTFLSIVSLLSVWSFRSLNKMLFSRNLFGNPWVPVSLAVSAGLHMLAVYVPRLQEFFGTVPLAAKDWLLIVALSLVCVVLIDLRKKLGGKFTHALPHVKTATG